MVFDIDKYDELPHKMSGGMKNIKYPRRYGKMSAHNVGDYSPYKIAEMVIESFIGKSYDKAFSHFCTLVPKYMQFVFDDVLMPNRKLKYPNYTLDENKVIIKYKYPKNKSVVYKSSDYIERIMLNKATNTYETVIVSGWKKEFATFSDPEYKKLIAEDRKYFKRLEKLKESTKDKFYNDILSSDGETEIIENVDEDINKKINKLKRN